MRTDCEGAIGSGWVRGSSSSPHGPCSFTVLRPRVPLRSHGPILLMANCASCAITDEELLANSFN